MSRSISTRAAAVSEVAVPVVVALVPTTTTATAPSAGLRRPDRRRADPTSRAEIAGNSWGPDATSVRSACRSTRPRRSRVVLMGTAALLGAVVSACGVGSTTPPSTGPGPTVSSTADAAPSDGTSPGSTTADCTPPDSIVAVVKGFAAVTGVQMIGGCGQVSVETSLPPGSIGTSSATTAAAICTAVSRVAYGGSVYGVSVDGQDGHELAAGVKDHPDCIPG
jgi:hypothetical protein